MKQIRSFKPTLNVLKTPDGFPVQCIARRYSNNGTLAVELHTGYEPYAVITVNLSGSPYGDGKYQDDRHAYIDTNNCPWAPQWLIENNLGKPDGRDIYGISGYCTYPLFEIFTENFDKNSEE